MERDPKTGRFLPGNQIAVGNRGNRTPKWGNKNALKHGLFQTIRFPRIMDDGWLCIYQNGVYPVKIKPGTFYEEDDGSIVIREDIAEELRKRGFVIDVWLRGD